MALYYLKLYRIMIVFSNEQKFSNFKFQISFSRLIELYIKRIEERNKYNKRIQEKSEIEKIIFYTSFHPFSSLYFHIIQNLWLKIKFLQTLFETYWSNPWYTIRVSILYTITLWESLILYNKYFVETWEYFVRVFV